jgi:hypothetical protein
MTAHGDDRMRKIEEIAEQVRLTKEVVSVLRTARSLVLDKEKRQVIDEKIYEAEISLNPCSIKIAKLTGIRK